jgi:SAM-dependent methyltransferase
MDGERIEAGVASDLPMPPAGLRYRVSGTDNEEWFHRCGEMTLSDFEDALESVGRRFEDFKTILDFGCGCGRVTRWLRPRCPGARISGCDIDPPAVEWMRREMPDVDARVTQGLPPLPFPDAGFDLVLGYSVFSHLDETYQDAWLTELRRVSKSGAILLLTVHADYHWQATLEAYPAIGARAAERAEKGFLYTKDDEWGPHFPDFYHTAWHTPEYVNRHWSKWFTVLGMRGEKGRPALRQDIVILRRG